MDRQELRLRCLEASVEHIVPSMSQGLLETIIANAETYEKWVLAASTPPSAGAAELL